MEMTESSLLGLIGAQFCLKSAVIEGIAQGSPTLKGSANLWRSGKAVDTIAVVIISKLPVLCLE